MIHLIREKATTDQIKEMCEDLETYIKLAVDIRQGILAGGGIFHADCESALLEDGSIQKDIWGADWIPDTQQVSFASIINIRPKQNNSGMEIQDPAICVQVETIIRELLGGVR